MDGYAASLGQAVDPPLCPETHRVAHFAAGVGAYIACCDGVEELAQRGGHMVARHHVAGGPWGRQQESEGV